MPNQINLRRGAPGDETALALVGQASFLEAFADFLNAADMLAHCQYQHAAEKYRAWLNDPKSIVWLAEVAPGAAPVGYLVLTVPDLPLPDISPQDFEVKRVYLLHRFQGRGVGRRLMAEAQLAAENAGARRLLLGVNAQNHTAIGFYTRLGYAPVGERQFTVGHTTYQDLILALPLNPRSGSG